VGGRRSRRILQALTPRGRMKVGRLSEPSEFQQALQGLQPRAGSESRLPPSIAAQPQQIPLRSASPGREWSRGATAIFAAQDEFEPAAAVARYGRVARRHVATFRAFFRGRPGRCWPA